MSSLHVDPRAVRLALAALADRLGFAEPARVFSGAPDAAALYAAGDALVSTAHGREPQRAAGLAAWALGDGRVDAAVELLEDVGEVVDADAALAADPDFQTVCDARRDAWIDHVDHFVRDEREPRDGELADHRACDGRGCGGCAFTGVRVYRAAEV